MMIMEACADNNKPVKEVQDIWKVSRCVTCVT